MKNSTVFCNPCRKQERKPTAKAEENLQAKSLRAIYDKYGYKGIRISMSDYREQEWLTNIPLYAFMRWMPDLSK